MTETAGARGRKNAARLARAASAIPCDTFIPPLAQRLVSKSRRSKLAARAMSRRAAWRTSRDRCDGVVRAILVPGPRRLKTAIKRPIAMPARGGEEGRALARRQSDGAGFDHLRIGRGSLERDIRIDERQPQMTRECPIKIVFGYLPFGDENAIGRDALPTGRFHGICQTHEGDAIVREKADLAWQMRRAARGRECRRREGVRV